LYSQMSMARNIDAPFFMLGWARCRFHKMRTQTPNSKIVFLHPVGSADQIVHSVVTRPQNTSMHYFSYSSGTGAYSTNSAQGHITLNLIFSIRCDLRVIYCILVCPGRETSTPYFSCSGGPCADSIKCTPRHLTLNLCFYIRWDQWVK
jgi:hypothetical protein